MWLSSQLRCLQDQSVSLKQHMIPRLELLSALLLVRLMSNVTQAPQEELQLSQPCCFTDSTVALYWITEVDKS